MGLKRALRGPIAGFLYGLFFRGLSGFMRAFPGFSVLLGLVRVLRCDFVLTVF